jgi:hypothetical protein
VVQISTDSNFGTTAFSQSGLTVPITSAGNLANGAAYFWRAGAANAGGSGSWSAFWSFTTVPAVPGIPALSLPTNGTAGLATSLTLYWGQSSSATSYILDVSTSSGFSTTLLSRSIATTSASVTGLAPGTTYYWQVAGVNSTGQGYWSVPWEFSTGGVGVLKDAGRQLQKTDFTIRGAAIEYALASPGALEIVFSDLLGRTALVINRRQAAGRYSLALRDCGLASGNYIVRFRAAGFDRSTIVMLMR